MLPFDPNETDAEWSQTERLIVARDHPEDSFIWWIEGQRNRAVADRAGIEAILALAYATAWPERLQRMVALLGFVQQDGWIVVPPGDLGRFEVYVGQEGSVLAAAACQAGGVALVFSLPELQFRVQSRCVSDLGGFRVRRAVRL